MENKTNANEELISKKALLEKYAISYGALYRWKRKGLIPEEWFIKKATVTGQETFFPRELICQRVELILNRKEEVLLDELSRKFYISKYYLTREFKKAYGETIFQHIIAMRINYAKRLLRFTDKSVDEIAELCGFHDQSYFTKQFKKAENMTCLAFRKRWRD